MPGLISDVGIWVFARNDAFRFSKYVPKPNESRYAVSDKNGEKVDDFSSERG